MELSFDEINEKQIIIGTKTINFDRNLSISEVTGKKQGAISLNGSSISLSSFSSCLNQHESGNYWCPNGFTLDFWFNILDFKQSQYFHIIRKVGKVDVKKGNNGLYNILYDRWFIIHHFFILIPNFLLN